MQLNFSIKIEKRHIIFLAVLACIFLAAGVSAYQSPYNDPSVMGHSDSEISDVSSGKIKTGTFGSSVGGGNFNFPANLIIQNTLFFPNSAPNNGIFWATTRDTTKPHIDYNPTMGLYISTGTTTKDINVEGGNLVIASSDKGISLGGTTRTNWPVETTQLSAGKISASTFGSLLSPAETRTYIFPNNLNVLNNIVATNAITANSMSASSISAGTTGTITLGGIARTSWPLATTTLSASSITAGTFGAGNFNFQNNLGVAGTLTAGAITLGTGTRNSWNLGSCSAGYVASGTDASGNVQCTSNKVDIGDCPSGQVATGTDTSGNFVCVNKVNPSLCPSGQVATGADPAGTIQCSLPSVKSLPASNINSGTFGSLISPTPDTGGYTFPSSVTAPSIVSTGTITLGGEERSKWPYISTGRVSNRENVWTIEGLTITNKGYLITDCKVIVSMEASNLGAGSQGTYGDNFDDLGEWGDNHYAGAQAFYDQTTWKVTCRFGFTIYDDVNPTWRDAKCRYLVICVK